MRNTGRHGRKEIYRKTGRLKKPKDIDFYKIVNQSRLPFLEVCPRTWPRMHCGASFYSNQDSHLPRLWYLWCWPLIRASWLLVSTKRMLDSSLRISLIPIDRVQPQTGSLRGSSSPSDICKTRVTSFLRVQPRSSGCEHVTNHTHGCPWCSILLAVRGLVLPLLFTNIRACPQLQIRRLISGVVLVAGDKKCITLSTGTTIALLKQGCYRIDWSVLSVYYINRMHLWPHNKRAKW